MQTSLCTKLEAVKFGLLWYLFSLHQMTTLHLAVQSNRRKMVECLLDQGADFNLEDENEVILHNYAVDYFHLSGRFSIHCLFPAV